MSKVIAAINMTLDGVCDHTAIQPDEEIHRHYKEIINGAGVLLYGRITFQLMKYWQNLVENPSGEKSMDEFAHAIDKVPKIVFSNKLRETGWDTARLSKQPIEKEVTELLKQSDKDILVGSRSLIHQLMKLNLINEFQLCVHPVVAGSGLQLFERLNFRSTFKLIKIKTFRGGAVTLYYEPSNE